MWKTLNSQATANERNTFCFCFFVLLLLLLLHLSSFKFNDFPFRLFVPPFSKTHFYLFGNPFLNQNSMIWYVTQVSIHRDATCPAECFQSFLCFFFNSPSYKLKDNFILLINQVRISFSQNYIQINFHKTMTLLDWTNLRAYKEVNWNAS